ncbi:MAG: D-alanyl-D-alanine carboxypeptidase, partial [Comamonas sp.]
ASPDALLVNYKALALSIAPDSGAGVARIQYDPPMFGMNNQETVPLAAPNSDCGDWRSKMQLDMNDPQRIAFLGAYPAQCGDKSWSIAPAQPERFAAKAIEGMWRDLGGKLTGSVRDGRVPAGLQPAFQSESPSLSEVVRDINKYSNNIMAQHVFLTLGMQRTGVASFEASRQALAQWWQARWGAAELPAVDNGAGLSRNAAITANGLGLMLQSAWASPVMPEFMASMPIVGVDGTLRRSNSKYAGAAHLKTGTLRDSTALAGYVDAANGRRYVLVAMANHANAGAARAAWDALIDWTAAQ